jgi:pimeloyl-ACP methyl ester carboxylesterase
MFDSTGAIRNTQAIEVANGTEVCITRQAGKPLLLLVRMASRGMGGWDGIWDGLCEHFSVAQFDLKRPTAAQLEQPVEVFKELARDCADVADGLGYDGFHILGWTGGAHLALRCAVDLPQRLLSCTVVNPFHPLPDMRPLRKGNEFMRTMLQGGGREIYTYYWFMAGLSPAFVRTRFDEVERMVKARLAADSFMQAQTADVSRWSEVLRGFWLEEAELASIKAPVLIVGSGLDPAFFGPSPDMARALHARLPGAELAMAEGYGSLMVMEAPQVFHQLSAPFHARVSGKAHKG